MGRQSTWLYGITRPGQVLPSIKHVKLDQNRKKYKKKVPGRVPADATAQSGSPGGPLRQGDTQSRKHHRPATSKEVGGADSRLGATMTSGEAATVRAWCAIGQPEGCCKALHDLAPGWICAWCAIGQPEGCSKALHDLAPGWRCAWCAGDRAHGAQFFLCAWGAFLLPYTRLGALLTSKSPLEAPSPEKFQTAKGDRSQAPLSLNLPLYLTPLPLSTSFLSQQTGKTTGAPPRQKNRGTRWPRSSTRKNGRQPAEPKHQDRLRGQKASGKAPDHHKIAKQKKSPLKDKPAAKRINKARVEERKRR